MIGSVTCCILRVTVANLIARGNSVNPGAGMWLVKSFLKKFQERWPLTEYIATYHHDENIVISISC